MHTTPSSSRLALILISATLGFYFGLVPRLSADEAAQLPLQPGLLVLVNGSVLEGMISRQGEHFHVLLPKGELRVAATQVDFFCHDLQEAYERRRARHGEESVDTHLELARWCLQQHLYDFAERELHSARAIDSEHSLVDPMARRIAQARDVGAKKLDIVNLVQHTDQQELIPVTPASAESHAEIPQWARVEFIKRVQPLLLHSCATAGCHLPNSAQAMQLDRRATDGAGKPALIFRNMESVLAVVDFDNPEESRLLALAKKQHASENRNASKPLTPRQLEILRAWVTQLASQRGSVTPVPATESVTAEVIPSSTPTLSAVKDPFDPSAFNRKVPQTEALSDSESTEVTGEQPATSLLEEVR